MAAFVGEHAPDSMPVRPDASDYEICMKARTLANDFVLRALGLDANQAPVVAARACAAYGVPMPAFEEPAQQVLRAKCELWWRRQLRRLHIRSLEHSNSPASLGTRILSFAAQNPAASPFASRKLSPANLFTAAELATIELDESATTPGIGVLFSRVAELLGMSKKKDASDETRFADVRQAVETLAAHGKQQADAVAALTQTVAELTGSLSRRAFS